MKKVFAILSVLALTIALVGMTVNPAVKADNLFTEDPTITENDIPMYIMDSIYTTFPAYYDYATAGDDNWMGLSRMYAWNETRLQVKQMDSEGNYTGKEYAIFFAGATSASEAGTGNNLLFYNVIDGNIVLQRMDGGKLGSAGYPMDPSLSHMRKNLSEEDIVFEPISLWSANGSSNGGNMLNRVMTFDAQGRMIRGLAGGVAYQKPGTEGALEVTVPAEYCYVNGVVTKAEAGVTCDKVQAAKVDPETGEPVLDPVSGEPVMEETDEDNYLYARYVWQWFTAEQYATQEVNEVPYLAEGWDAMKWDYSWEDADGYMCIAFVPSENSTAKLTADQLAVYTATCEANGQAAPDANATRKCAEMFYVPAGGWTYDFGYLDKGKNNLYNCFVDMLMSGYKYGRTVDAEGKGMAAQKTYDFSAKPLYATDVVAGGVSYQVMEGQNVIEVMQGEEFIPSKNVVYTGLSKYWATPGDLTSFKSDTTVLDMYITLDGVTQVQPNTGYTCMDDVIEDFMADWNEYAAANGKTQMTVKPTASMTDQEMFDNFYQVLGWDLASTSDNSGCFTGISKYWTKWQWMFEYISAKCVANGVSAVVWNGKGAVPSPGSSRDALFGFFTEIEKRSIPITSANTCADFSNGKATEWLDSRTNLEKWQQFSIDTSTAAVDTNYVVGYKVYNQVTGIESQFTLTFVVVDEYTPILKINKNNLIYAPTKLGDALVMPTIDKSTLVTAYNAKYNGSSILGDEITYKVHFESATLDFDNVTEGEHKVTATVYSASGAKYASKTFVVSVEDMTAPIVRARDFTLAYGADFKVQDGITYAYDKVDGNLMDNNLSGWIYDNSKNKVNTEKAGKYTVQAVISDASGNETEVSYKVTVLPQVNLSGIEDATEELQAALLEQKALVEGLQEQLESLQAAVDAGFMPDTSKCGSKSALVVELLAATSLLVVFLKKKH